MMLKGDIYMDINARIWRKK